MQTSLFDFHLPPQSIAQEPLPNRDASRLLALDRDGRSWQDSTIRSLPGFLRPGDLLILNDTRVIPARLRATRDSSKGKIEILLLPPETTDAMDSNIVLRRVLIRSRGTLELGETLTLTGGGKVTLRQRMREAGDLVEFHCSPQEFEEYVRQHGEVPLPPYIHRPAGPSLESDRQRYQTVFARTPGAVAAPTAGLHFSEALFEALKARGIDWKYVTLHVGPGTFRPVKADTVEQHFVDPEPYVIPAETVRAVAEAKRARRRIVAVGTTSLRALEGSLADAASLTDYSPRAGSTGLYVYPPYEFKVVDALLTNFHIPKSSLLMLVCAFAAPGKIDGIEFVKRAYAHAVESGYRFYSYGDACLFC